MFDRYNWATKTHTISMTPPPGMEYFDTDYEYNATVSTGFWCPHFYISLGVDSTCSGRVNFICTRKFHFTARGVKK